MGLIAISAVDQQPKIKIYRDSNEDCKGDCALCYNAEVSLAMALEVLHEGYIRPGYKITVKRAEFQAREDGGAGGNGTGGNGTGSRGDYGNNRAYSPYKAVRRDDTALCSQVLSSPFPLSLITPSPLIIPSIPSIPFIPSLPSFFPSTARSISRNRWGRPGHPEVAIDHEHSRQEEPQ